MKMALKGGESKQVLKLLGFFPGGYPPWAGKIPHLEITPNPGVFDRSAKLP